MPGTHLLASASPIGDAQRNILEGVESGLLHGPSYAAQRIHESEHCILSLTGYPAYPHTVYRAASWLVSIEGIAYGRSTAELGAEIVSGLEALRGGSDEPLRRLIGSLDGEIIVVAHDTATRDTYILDDALGKLPFYYAQVGDRLIASREVKFIVPHLSELAFEHDALEQYMLFGFPFGESTLLRGIEYLPAGTMLHFDPAGNVTMTALRPERWDVPGATGTRDEQVDRMAELFLEAVDVRASAMEGRELFMSLSGGLDSRATFAALKRLGYSPRTLSSEGPEFSFATDVAEKFGAPIEMMPIAPADQSDFERFVSLKDGLDSHSGLAQLYHNMENVQRSFGSEIVYFTGSLGGELTRYIHPTSGLGSLSAVPPYLLRTNDSYKYSTEKTCELLGLREDEVLARVAAHLDSYPERDPYSRFRRFRNEFDRKWAGEAEDRNRFYFWPITPFLALPFFEYVASIEENLKGLRLFVDFLAAIDPRATSLKYYNYRMPLDNQVMLRAVAMAERAARVPVVKTAVRLPGTIPRPWEGDKLQDQKAGLYELFESTPVAERHFSAAAVRRVIDDETDSQGLDRLWILFTYMGYADNSFRSYTS